jgi:hypothetical protein
MRRDYTSPQAARRGITDRLARLAEQVEWPLNELQRQYGYDRLLARLYATDPAWIIKGAVALLARQIAVRRTIDIDLYRAGRLRDAEAALRSGAAVDLGDWADSSSARPRRLQSTAHDSA